ncbi:MAG: hypothetical protein ACFCD0_17020 [Gemmataceae bacterium]
MSETTISRTKKYVTKLAWMISWSLRALRPGQFPIYAAGLALFLSGLVHVGVWFVEGSSWQGPLSWRKPILFGLSGGVTAISVGWVLGVMPRWKLDRWLGWTFAISIVIEVALITMQTWRGVRSHFNHETAFDEGVYGMMGVLILIVTFIIGFLAVRSHSRLETSPSMGVAIRGGLWFLLAACLLGWLIQQIGEQQLASGGNAEIYGQAGVLKFPHGMSLHAIQALPILVWMCAVGGSREGQKLWAVWSAVVGYLLLTIYSVVQTFEGRARYDLTMTTGALLLLGMAGVGLPFLLATVGMAKRPFKAGTTIA